VNGDHVPQDVTSLAVMVGEMRGQLREAVHTLNNVSGKIDGLTREVLGLGPIAADLIDLKARIKVLEETDNRQAGAAGIVQAILKSPLIGWLVGVVVSAWAVLTGKVHL
jgi:hypothetical protein